MGGFQFPILSVIIFTPIVAALVILAIDASRRDLIRGVAITAASIVLVLSAAVYFGYNSQVSVLTTDLANIAATGGPFKSTLMFMRGLAFEENVPWVSTLGISYHLGVDGLNTP